MTNDENPLTRVFRRIRVFKNIEQASRRDLIDNIQEADPAIVSKLAVFRVRPDKFLQPGPMLSQCVPNGVTALTGRRAWRLIASPRSSSRTVRGRANRARRTASVVSGNGQDLPGKHDLSYRDPLRTGIGEDVSFDDPPEDSIEQVVVGGVR